MENFYYSIPTRVYFGKGQIKNLSHVIKEFGKNVLLVYGGGSIKKTGVYDAVIEQLAGCEIKEVSGVAPNPKIDSVREGVKICKAAKIDAVIAVGGGSVVDCAKVIAASASYEGDPWDIVLDSSKIKSVLPIICVMTLAATGSEMDNCAVITNMETNDKLDTGCDAMKPAVAIMDPTYTFSVSKRQTAAGTADITSHIFENYFNHTPSAEIQAGFAETLLRVCFKNGVIAYHEPDNYDARANLMWAASWAINGILDLGCGISWSCHAMEHELSAFYDVTHGAGLAVLTPVWMEYVLNDKTVDRMAQYGVNVWGIDSSLDKYEIAREAIKKTRGFYDELELPRTLGELGIGEEKLEIMAKKAAAHGFEHAFYPLTEADILAIFNKCL